MTDIVLKETRDDVAIITLNEPDRLNPLSDSMRVRLLAEMEAAIADDGVRTIVITGAGRHFSAGADISQLGLPGGPDPARSRRRLAPLHRLMELIVCGPKPVIAAVEGAAFGAGFSIAAGCDFLVAGEGARFGAAFGKIGLTADCGLPWTLPQRVGRTAARDILFTGRPVPLDEAVALGLVDRAVAAGTALEEAMAKAADYRGNAPLSIASMKLALGQGFGPFTNALATELVQQPMLSMTADHGEGIAAFKEKRPPVFQGR